jgi:hypothetical protein
LPLLIAMVVFGAAGFGFLRVVHLGPLAWLNSREWSLALKIVSIAAIVVVLLLAGIAKDLPASLFLYGRF